MSDTVVTVVKSGAPKVIVTHDPGPSGPSGSAASVFEFVKSVAATVWTIDHPLLYDPLAIQVITNTGEILSVNDIQYTVTGHQLRISFDTPVAGKARLR